MNLALVLFVSWVVLFLSGLYIYPIILNRGENEDDKWYDQVLFFLWLMTFVFAFHIQKTYENSISYNEEKHVSYISSLGNDKYTNGDFFLGSGDVDEVDYYFFYVKTNAGYRREKIPVRGTYIVETDKRRSEYVIVVRKYDDKDRFWKVLFDNEIYNKLYVPKNTIIKDFKVR